MMIVVVVGDDDRGARMTTMHAAAALGRMRVEHHRSGRAREVVGKPPLACSTMPQFERRRRIRSAMMTTVAHEAIVTEMYGGERYSYYYFIHSIV